MASQPTLLKNKRLKPFEIQAGMYNYRYLPELATLIMRQYLKPYAQEQLQLCFDYQLPMITILANQYSTEQLEQISIESSREFLTYLSENKSAEQISSSLEKWVRDELEIISKVQINAADITLINYIRQQSLKKWIPIYTTDIQKVLELTSEIDNFVLGAVTSSTNTYIDMLKDMIEQESYLSKKIIEASPAITFIFDLKQQKESFVSNNVNEVLGYEPGYLLQAPTGMLMQLTHPEDLPLIKNHFAYIVADNRNKTYQFEYRFRHADGTYRWLRTYEVIFKRDEEGKPVELLGKTFEITGEKEIALALTKSEQQLLEAQSIAHIGSYEWNIRDNESTNTDELIKIFELSTSQRYEEFINHVHPADQAKVKDAIEASFKSGNYDCEYRYQKNGKEKVLWSLGKIQYEDHQPVKMVGTVQDITEMKQLELELMKKTEELERSNESLQHFASVASHDLKDPLRKINMFTEMVVATEAGRLSPSSENYLKKTQEASRRMQQMIEDILSFSSLTTADDKQPVSLQMLVDETLDLLEPVILESKAVITTDQLPEATVSPSQFKQLFQNLISNSLKFSKKDEPPHISLTHLVVSPEEISPDHIGEAANYLQLKITDNGIGFKEEYAEKIFGLFNRLHSKNAYAGTGLGLAICKRIIENHHGVIKAVSQPGAGATFEIIIPYN